MIVLKTIYHILRLLSVRLIASDPQDYYCFLSQSAVVFGSNRTHVPILKQGIRPAFACLKIVMRENEQQFS